MAKPRQPYKPPLELVRAAELGIVEHSPTKRADEQNAWRTVARYALDTAAGCDVPPQANVIEIPRSNRDLEKHLRDACTVALDRLETYVDAIKESRDSAGWLTGEPIALEAADDGLVLAVRSTDLLLHSYWQAHDARQLLTRFDWRRTGSDDA